MTVLNSTDATVQDKWTHWMSIFKKEFDSAEEEAKRFNVFMMNESRILLHNAKKEGWTMGHNQFSIMTDKEFAEFSSGSNQASKQGERKVW